MSDLLHGLLWGDAKLIEAQAPVARPDPIPRPDPVERPTDRGARRAQPPTRSAQPAPQLPAQPQTPQSGGLLDELLWGTPQQKPSPTPQPVVAAPAVKPIKDEGWLEWFGNNVKGRQDPRFKDAPALRSVLSQEYGWNFDHPSYQRARQLSVGQMLTPDDKAHADIARKALGDRFIGAEQDAYGADLVRFRDEKGQPTVAYINKPGLDTEDIGLGIAQATPYVLGGRAIGGSIKGPILGPLAQGAGAFNTSLAGDLAATQLGSEQPLDFARATVVGGVGTVAEGLSPLLGMLKRKLFTEPSLYDKATGKLTEKGIEAARRAHFDPADLAQISGETAEQFAKSYARLRDPVVAGQSVRTAEFDLPVTKGQLTKDPGRLLNEKGMRYGAFGDAAKQTMQAFDSRQAIAVEQAALGGEKKSVAKTINPDRSAQVLKPGNIGEEIRGGVRSARDAAKVDERLTWNQVGELRATDEALQYLPSFISYSVRDVASNITSEIAPRTSGMIEALRRFHKGGAPEQADDFLGNVTMPTVDTMRRTLLAMMKGTRADDFDGMAARRVYDGFNRWIDDVADAKLLAGDPNAAGMMRLARDRTREMKEIFGERDLAGMSSPGRQLVAKILNDDGLAPESIVRQLFGVEAGASPKAGAIEALSRIKSGANRYLPKDQAQAVWNDVRLAYWMNLVRTPSGEMHTPTMLAKRIQEASSQQGSVLRELYKPEEIALIRRFGAAMKDISFKDPNPSGTGTANLFYGSQWGQALLSTLGSYNGPVARVTQLLLRSTPLKEAGGMVAAQSAISARPRTLNPSLGPISGAITAQSRE